MSLHDQAVIDAAEAWERMPAGEDFREINSELCRAVRARREAMKPKPRYEILDHPGARTVRDRESGLWLTLGEVVALLNRQEEK